MFQAVPSPIIRSLKLYTQHRIFVELFLLLTAIVSELELTQDSGKILLSDSLMSCNLDPVECHSSELLP